MKKFIIYMLVAFLVAISIPMAPVEAANSTSVSIPVTTGVIGNDGSAKSFVLDLPSNVVSSSISTSSLKYVGSNEVVGSITLENGKIKVTLKGVSNSKTIDVYGYNSGNGLAFNSNIGNSIWRYSDGRRWQINDYNPTTDRMESRDKSAEDSAMPSKRVPITMVNAKSNQITAGRYWYTSAGEKIDSQYIVTNTIKTELMDKSAYVKEVKFPNSNIVTTYKIPIDDLDEDWLDVTETATMPITQHVEGRFYSAWVAYYYKATAKLTSYSYGGKVSFDYSPPTEPTLDGSVSVLKPSPNPAKFEGKDTAVSLKVKGDLLAYTNSSNIEEWVFYAKETGSPDVKTKKDYNKVLTSTQTFDNFVISKSRGSNVKQEYTLTVTVRFSKPVVTGSGTISSLSKTMKATVEVSDAPVFSPPPVNNNKPPVAVLDVPGEVKAGSEFLMYGKDSYDPDGKIVKYYYSAPNTMEPVDGEFGFTWYPLSALGEHSVLLTVTDNGGLTGSTSAKINVIQPTPVAEIFVDGTKKENRKVTLVSRSRSPEHYPIDESKTQWAISAVSGGTAADIKYLGALSGMNSIDVLFKKPGTYRATITVTNTAGFSHSTSTTFEIVPDEVPVVYISVPNKIYRDPGQGNMASAALTDMSFSPDFDFIGRRIWEYRYDSNNDGNFTDESWVIFSNENKSAFNLQLGKVGRYEIKLTVIEEFDQPTIEELVTVADRKSADSYTSVPQQPLGERLIEVYNRAPEVDWSW